MFTRETASTPLTPSKRARQAKESKRRAQEEAAEQELADWVGEDRKISPQEADEDYVNIMPPTAAETFENRATCGHDIRTPTPEPQRERSPKWVDALEYQDEGLKRQADRLGGGSWSVAKRADRAGSRNEEKDLLRRGIEKGKAWVEKKARQWNMLSAS